MLNAHIRITEWETDLLLIFGDIALWADPCTLFQPFVLWYYGPYHVHGSNGGSQY